MCGTWISTNGMFLFHCCCCCCKRKRSTEKRTGEKAIKGMHKNNRMDEDKEKGDERQIIVQDQSALPQKAETEERAWFELGDMKAINKAVTSPCRTSECLKSTLSMFIFVFLAFLLHTLGERIRVRRVCEHGVVWHGTHTFTQTVLCEPIWRWLLCMYCTCACVHVLCCYGLFLYWCVVSSNAETSDNRILSASCLCMEWHYKRIIIISRDSKSLVDMNRHANFGCT